MKRTLFIILLVFIFSFTLNAEEYLIKSTNFFRHDFPNSVPQTFLINRKGEVIYHEVSESRGIRQALNSPKKIKDSQYHMSQLTKVLGEEVDYNETDYTLVEIIWDKGSFKMNCDPCDNQVKINNAFIKVMTKKNISINRNTILIENVSSFIKDW